MANGEWKMEAGRWQTTGDSVTDVDGDLILFFAYSGTPILSHPTFDSRRSTLFKVASH